MLIRPKIIPYESFQSYLYRLLAVNGLKYLAFGAFLSRNVAPIKSQKLCDRKKIKRYVATTTKQDAILNSVDLSEIAYQHPKIVYLSTIKVCPICYQNQNILPAFWYFKHYVTCATHKTLMIDSCTSCSTQFTEDTFISGHCQNCKMALIIQSETKVEVDVYSSLIHHHFSGANLGSDQYISLIYEYLIKAPDQDLGADTVLGYLSYFRHTKKHERNYTNIERHDRQLARLQILNDADAVRDILLQVAKVHVNANKNSARDIFFPISELVGKKGGNYFIQILRDLLTSNEPEINELSAGGNWLAKIFSLEKDLFNKFIKENFKHVLYRQNLPIKFLNQVLTAYEE
jgi:hypothetical protein